MADDSGSYAAHELSWQRYTKFGNQKMQEQHYVQAEQHYSHALEIAELLLAEAKTNGSYPTAIHPYVISHNNLADVYLHLGLPEKSEDTLLRVHSIIISVLNDSNLPSPLRLESFKALKIVAFELNQLYHQLNQDAKAELLFAQTAQQARSFLAEFDFTSLEASLPDDSA